MDKYTRVMKRLLPALRDVVGIDFGTKSTVVVYENERGEIIPLQVGNGDYSKGVKASNYENPTIIEFRHIENFLAAYRDRDGRPKTSWATKLFVKI